MQVPDMPRNFENISHHARDRRSRMESAFGERLQREASVSNATTAGISSGNRVQDHASTTATSAHGTMIDFLIEQLLGCTYSYQTLSDIREDRQSPSEIPHVVQKYLSNQ